jgi:hypothetical protein
VDSPLFRRSAWNFGHAEFSRLLPALIVNVAVADELLALAVIVALTVVVTVVVVAVKVAVVAPDATVTVFGTVAEVLLLLRFTTYPAVRAADEIVTVPVDEDPPPTEEGFITKDATVGALTVSVPV